MIRTAITDDHRFDTRLRPQAQYTNGGHWQTEVASAAGHNAYTLNGADRIAVPVNDGLQFLPITDIVRMEAQGSYTRIFRLSGGPVLSSRPLKDYDILLQDRHFFRTHHSHIINLLHLQRYHRGNGGYVTMNDGSVVDVSKRRKKDFLDMVDGRVFSVAHPDSGNV